MLADRYLRTDFASQEDFEQNFRLTIPEHFHFAYDVVDEYARTEPDKRAMIWCDVAGRERVFTFTDFSRLSDRAANVFKAQGLKKGDPVLLMLKRRYQFWIAALGLLKVGCVLIPATAQLQKKDIVYRVEASSAKAIVCVEEPEVRAHVADQAKAENALGRRAAQPFCHFRGLSRGEGKHQFPEAAGGACDHRGRVADGSPPTTMAPRASRTIASGSSLATFWLRPSALAPSPISSWTIRTMRNVPSVATPIN